MKNVSNKHILSAFTPMFQPTSFGSTGVYMRKFILTLGFVITTSFFIMTSAYASKDDSETAAVVNGQKITVTEINRVVQSLPQYHKLQLEMLEDMIVKTLIYQESVKSGIVVEKSEVDAGFKEYIKRLNLTDEVVKREMKRMNISEDVMKEEIRKQLLVERFLKNRAKSLNLTVSDEEVRSFYNENPDTFNTPERVQIRHILVQFDPTDKKKTEAARKKIQDVKDKIKRKEGSFTELAKKYSDDQSNVEAVGEITRNSPLPKAFIDAAFALGKDQVSDVIRTPSGFHLIQMVEKKPAGKTQLNEIKDSLKFRLLEQKNNNEMKKYVDSLVEKSKIEIKMEKRNMK